MTAVSIEAIVRALGGHKVGPGWMVPCPAHTDRTSSLSVCQARGKVLVHCHAGCPQNQVIDALRERGLWTEADVRKRPIAEGRPGASDFLTHSDASRTMRAVALWSAGKPAAGTLLEVYLASRGILLPPPPTLRFHPALRHPSGGTWPAMLGLVTRGIDDAPIAVHRTFLALNGSGKAPVVPARMVLGPCRGGAVRLGGAGRKLMVGEGIETCLAAIQATSLPAWAALSTSGLVGLDLPAEVNQVVVLADGDDPGESAAQQCAHRFRAGGRLVRIARPPRGFDFNDLLKQGAAEREHSA